MKWTTQMLLIYVSRASYMHRIFLTTSYKQTYITHNYIYYHSLSFHSISSQNSKRYITIRDSETAIWNLITKSMKLHVILILLWNKFITYIFPEHSDHLPLIRWDYPSSKNKSLVLVSHVLISYALCLKVHLKEYKHGVGSQREGNVTEYHRLFYSIWMYFKEYYIFPLFLSSIILISFLTWNLLIISKRYEIIFS